jgi:transcriptional regulator with XRE-family HTH domain
VLIVHNFQNTLKTLRKNRKLSQQTVATNIGVSQQAYGLYERGKREPNLETLVKLANYFGTSIDFLIGRVIEVVTDVDPAQVARARIKYNSNSNTELAKKLALQGLEVGVSETFGYEPVSLYPEFEKDVQEEIRKS